MAHQSHHIHTQGGEGTYIVGFLLSFALTGVAFFLVDAQMAAGGLLWSRSTVIGAVILLAIVQLAVQVVCFLHLEHESTPRWRLLSFAFAGMFVLTVVVGSLWIMANLNYNMMAPDVMDAYMLDQ